MKYLFAVIVSIACLFSSQAVALDEVKFTPEQIVQRYEAFSNAKVGDSFHTLTKKIKLYYEAVEALSQVMDTDQTLALHRLTGISVSMYMNILNAPCFEDLVLDTYKNVAAAKGVPREEICNVIQENLKEYLDKIARDGMLYAYLGKVVTARNEDEKNFAFFSEIYSVYQARGYDISDRIK